MHTIRELAPIERKQQLSTYVDFFVKEFISEIWYIEETARGNLPGRSEASMGTLVNIVCGILNLAPIPGAALGFLASYKLIEGATKLVEGLDKPLSDYAAGVASAFVDNVREISDTDGDVAEVRGPGRDAAVDDGKPIDTESMAVLARWLGHQLAQRYEYLLTERLSTKPEEAVIGLARIGARRSLAFLSEHGGMKGTPEERAEKLLSGVVYGKSTSWSKRKLKWFAKQEKLIGRDEVRHEAFYAEKAYVTGAWYPCAGELPKTEPSKVEWLKKPFSNQPKYGYIRGSYEKANSTLYGSYAAPLEPWLPQRYYQPITKAQIMAYLACPEVVNAKAEQRTATTSLHQFLAAQSDSKFPDYGRAVFRGDLTNVNLSSGNFAEADLSGSRIGGDLSHCCFDSTQLFTAQFIAITSSVGSVVSFTKAEMGFSDLSYANMQGEVDFTQADLSCTNLTAAKFGAIQHVGTQWYKAVLKDVEYEAIVKEQHEQLSDVATKQAAQARELAVLNDKIAGLVERAQPLFDQLEANIQPPAAGAGAGAGTSGRSTPDLVTSDQREELETLLSCQEKRLQFEAYAQAKLQNSRGRENLAQVVALKAELERVQAQRDGAEAELQGQLAALDARVERLEASAVFAGTRFKVLTQQLSQLKETIARQAGLQISESMPLEEREAIIAKSALRKVIAQYLKGLSHKQQDLYYYVRPNLISDFPGNLTVGEYVAQVEQGRRDDDSIALLDEVESFLSSDDKVLLLLGEAGAGKSLFSWYWTQMRLKQYQEILSAEAPGEAEWLPLVIELKNYRLSEIQGMLPRYLQSICELEAEELKAIQGGSRSAQKLLVILDGFDELKQPAEGKPDIRQSFYDCFEACGAVGWTAERIKLVITCRAHYLTDRYLERQYFGHGEGKYYRRRIMLPFSGAKIAEYLHERAAHSEASQCPILPIADYQTVLAQSKSVKEMVRNPFVLRLFVEALPTLIRDGGAMKRINRFDIYQGFVSQWFERNVTKLDEATKLELGVDRLGVKAVTAGFVHYAALLANEMYRRNSLVVSLSDVKSEHPAFKVWSGLENELLEEIEHNARLALAKRFQGLNGFEKRRLARQGLSDEASYIDRHLDDACEFEETRAESGLQVFKIASPLRQAGQHYSFIHKSFYEFFIAIGIIQAAACEEPLENRVQTMLAMLVTVPEYASRRLWQEPDVLDFVCDFWAKASRGEKDRLKETWFAVIDATKGHPEYGSAGANVATLLNWVNVSFTYKKWHGVHLPGVDLRGAYLEGTDLQEADLSGAWLGKVQANKVNLSGAKFTGAEFSERPAVSLDSSCEAVAYHPIKPIIAVAHGKVVRQYDVASNCWLKPLLKGHTKPVTSISYSRDGHWLASSSADKTVRQWDAVSGEVRGEPLIGHTKWVTCVQYSPDGCWLVSGSNDNTIQQWDAITGEEHGAPFVGHENGVTSVSYSPDGRWLASASRDNTIRQWDAVSGEARGEPLVGHGNWVTSVTYSPDGRWLASGSRDNTIRQWEAASGEHRGVPLLGHSDWVTSICYSPDGSRLASSSMDKTILQWDVASGEQRGAALVGHTDWVVSVSYSPNGAWLVSGSGDKTIRMWPVAIGEQRGAVLVGHTENVISVDMSADGCWLASGSQDNTILQWDVATGEARGEPLVGHTYWITCVSYSPDGRWLASGSSDNTVRQWDAASGKGLGRVIDDHSDVVTSVCYSPDGYSLASGSADNTIRQWVASSGEMRGAPLVGHSDAITSISYSPDGTLLASGSFDKTIRQWSTVSGKPRGTPLHGHTDWVTSVMYCPIGGQLVSGSCDRTLRQWDANSGAPIGAPLLAHAKSVNSVSYSSDGSCLVSGSDDKTIRLWSTESGMQRGVLVGHTSKVESVAFSPDGSAIASCSQDGTIRYWVHDAASSLASVASAGAGAPSEASDSAEGSWRLSWGTKSPLMQLSGCGMKLSGAIGLEPQQLELLRQHGYQGGVNPTTGQIEDGRTTETYRDPSDIIDHLSQVGLFAGSPSGATATGGGEEAKKPDSSSELSPAHSGK